ncbi:hypothetical protein CC79DRAFT_1379851 [Sarocladium strictum]
MRLTISSLFAVWASTVSAAALIPSSSTDHVEFFKRDHVLDASDIELAEAHGVNLTEMYKHSVVKRDDEEDITVWVHKSFEEDGIPAEQSLEQSSELNKRDQRLNTPGIEWWEHGLAIMCHSPERYDVTGPKGAFTGGIIHMRDWCYNLGRGNFPLGGPYYGSGWRTLMTAGSNSGANVMYRAQLRPGGNNNKAVFIGVLDIWDDLKWTYSKRKVYSGKERAASWGYKRCMERETGHQNGVEFRIQATDDRVN